MRNPTQTGSRGEYDQAIADSAQLKRHERSQMSEEYGSGAGGLTKDDVRAALAPDMDVVREGGGITRERKGLVGRGTYTGSLAEEETQLAAELAHIRRSPAIYDVARERSRQVDAEGWSPEHDDTHGDGSIALAGACYAMFASVSDNARLSAQLPASLTVSKNPIEGWSAWLSIWPWERSLWKPTDRRRDLVQAAALIIAEIERLDRCATSEGSTDV